jgi:hypothetical protein
MKKRGRKSTFNEKDAAEIVDRLGRGEPLAVICRDDWLPAYRTVYDWVAAHADFAANIAGAREAGFDVIAAECLEIAEDGSRDYAERERPDGTKYEAFDSEHVQRSRLRIDTRLKLLAKWDPRRYGDKVSIVGGDPSSGDRPIQSEVTVRFVRPGDVPEPA